MKFDITLFESNPNQVKIANTGEIPYKYEYGDVKVNLNVDSVEILPTLLAKALFGDWEQEGVFKETKRRNEKGIHYDITIIHEKAPAYEDKLEKEERPDVQEAEFKSMIEEKQCEKITKNDKQCKRTAVKGTDCCSIHQ